MLLPSKGEAWTTPGMLMMPYPSRQAVSFQAEGSGFDVMLLTAAAQMPLFV
jgi:hypothetical protein